MKPRRQTATVMARPATRHRLATGLFSISVLAASAGLWACGDDDDGRGSGVRSDDSVPLEIAVSGSLQNPAFSPGGDRLLFTRFRHGYNEGPADLFILDIANGTTRTLVSDGTDNINLPGSAWNQATGTIVFSSSRDPHDEIFVIDESAGTGDEVQVTRRADLVAYEPSFSPDGQWVVFESHVLDVEGDGVITRYRVDGTSAYEELTDAGDDCRQPNWSPAGNLILYQRFSAGRWNIWVTNPDGTGKQQVTNGPGDKTDASFSPDGERIVYSADNGELEFANLFVIEVTGGQPVQVTYFDGYDGAPSWSADGNFIAFESYPGDPDDSAGTTLRIIDVSSRFP